METSYKIYGVKNDEQIAKLLEILEDCEIEFDFFDYRDCPPTNEQIINWAEFEGDDFPINLRSTFFKKNKKHFVKLSHDDKCSWLRKNYICLLRPVIENEENEILSIGGRPEKLASKIFGLEKDL